MPHGNLTHGQRTTGYKSPEYISWANMKSRCNNPSHKDYKYYGGRGITYCAAWEHFVSFLQDMGSKPAKSLTLDRIDNNASYSKENCRWTDLKQQNNNRNKFNSFERILSCP